MWTDDSFGDTTGYEISCDQSCKAISIVVTSHCHHNNPRQIYFLDIVYKKKLN